jgi:hypothetical protein
VCAVSRQVDKQTSRQAEKQRSRQQTVVPGAAAEVAVERPLHRGKRGPGGGGVTQQGVQAHDDAGGAEPTLGAVALRNPLLWWDSGVTVLLEQKGEKIEQRK